MDVFLACLIGSSAGGVFVASIARWLVQKLMQRAIESFDTLAKKIAEIDRQLAVILTRLELLAKHEDMIHDHDRKIVALEARFGDRKRNK